jgi:hypothetical protein
MPERIQDTRAELSSAKQTLTGGVTFSILMS